MSGAKPEKYEFQRDVKEAVSALDELNHILDVGTFNPGHFAPGKDTAVYLNEAI